jgi:hypothetical protein
MTREDIIRMAREELWGISTGRWLIPTEALERIVNRAVEAEREACAKVCEPQDKWDDPLTAWSIAQAIRARGSNGTPS